MKSTTTKSAHLFRTAGALLVITAFSFFSCEKDKPSKPAAIAVLSATNPETPVQGTLKFYQEAAGGVTLKLDILVPSKKNSSVALHIHEHGMCGNGGADAHGHWNPTGTQHGKWGSASYHAGDIGNIQLDEAGKGSLTLTTSLWTINSNALNDILGKGIIVHSGVDDYTSQPSGNSGPRIGCGVIEEAR